MNAQKFASLEQFKLDPSKHQVPNFALISLRKALISYYSTYQPLKHEFKRLTRPVSVPFKKEQLNIYYTSIEYLENYTETIVHFHHFIELVCKDILRSKHPLLVVNTQNKHKLLFQLIENPNDVNNEEIENLNTIDFKSMVDRIIALLSINGLDVKYSMIKEYADDISQLTIFRNEITHKGVSVLKYSSLDIFIGKYILPLVEKLMDLPEYIDYKYIIKPLNISSSICPVDGIINECKNKDGNFNFEKIAILKELGRASFLNPITDMNGMDKRDESESKNNRIRAFKAAEFELELYSVEASIVEGVKSCPVCGLQSLVTYLDSIDPDDSSYNYNIMCHCCSFELQYEVGNPKDYGLPINDIYFDL